MNKGKLLILIALGLLIITSISLVVSVSTRDTEKGALQPTVGEKAVGMIGYSNPRYQNGTMIDWESKR